ncbi:AMP-binding protein, partial [Streptomyces sp. TR06-5]|uniref:AMP-binding protein n=1 Tax=unclassified Streptomyces TaxID=2593676 RepID=UPI00399EF5B5
MFAAYCSVLERLAGDEVLWSEGPGSLVPVRQRELVASVNDTAGAVPGGLLYSGVQEWAREEPERVAVVDVDGELSFGEVWARACGVGRRLRGLGVGPNQLVAVGLPKGRAQVVAALGVMLAGGAYLPVDPELPA